VYWDLSVYTAFGPQIRSTTLALYKLVSMYGLIQSLKFSCAKPFSGKAKFHYASWFEADHRQVRSLSATSFEPVCDQLRISFEPASVMEFGFNSPHWSTSFPTMPSNLQGFWSVVEMTGRDEDSGDGDVRDAPLYLRLSNRQGGTCLYRAPQVQL